LVSVCERLATSEALAISIEVMRLIISGIRGFGGVKKADRRRGGVIGRLVGKVKRRKEKKGEVRNRIPKGKLGEQAGHKAVFI
jgi:hypothetical protein